METKNPVIKSILETRLTTLNDMLETSAPRGDGKGTYIQPKRQNAAVVTLVLAREIISPFVCRNENEETTDIDVPGLSDGMPRARAVANKFKFGERGAGLRLLREYNAGGACAQNRTAVPKGGKASDVFDMNTALFGDSMNLDSKVLPVRAGVSYSDALSVAPKDSVEGRTFHIASAEEGTLWEQEDKKNSSNLFNRIFLKPGTILLQTLTIRGKVLPQEALEHLLLAMGSASSAGGQTSIYSTNIKTHLLGVYGGKIEKPMNSPYELLVALEKGGIDLSNASIGDIAQKTHELFSAIYPDSVDRAAAEEWREGLLSAYESEDAEIAALYDRAKKGFKVYFDGYFGNGK